MSNATKFLLLAFSLGITCLLIIYFKQVADAGFKTTGTAKDKIERFEKELAESDLTMYEGYDVSGSDVVNFIKENLGGYSSAETAPVYIQIYVGATHYEYINNLYFSNIQDFSSPLYIKPVATYTCSIVRDANEVIVGVKFTKR